MRIQTLAYDIEHALSAVETRELSKALSLLQNCLDSIKNSVGETAYNEMILYRGE